jgi:2-polyprenyl-6-methoxyphenol hydroxylase-like FAD-dependent oxidoreductase
MSAPSADVLIVGAGPTGLAAAVVLTQLGHDVVIVDAQEDGVNTSRAVVVHARTLEVLEPHGVTEQIVARGLQASRFSVRDRDRVLVPLSFATQPTRYPYALMLSQADVERLLNDRLVALGGKVMRPRTLQELRQDDAGATGTFADGQSICARYVVGADGMHSTVRESAGIAFDGSDYPASFTLADVRLSGRLPTDEVILYLSPAGLAVLAPLPDGAHRVVAAVDDAPVHPGLGLVQHLLDTRGPQREPVAVREVLWGSRFRVHHRIASVFRDQRVLLAGDAAHVHSPAGGQGMNLGIEDAVELAETLARVLDGESAAALDGYATRRKKAARKVVAFTDRLTRLATISASVRPARNAVLGAIGHVAPLRRRFALRLAGLDRRPPDPVVRAAGRWPGRSRPRRWRRGLGNGCRASPGTARSRRR